MNQSMVAAIILTIGSAVLFYCNWPLQSCKNMVTRSGAWLLGLCAAALWLWTLGWHVGIGAVLYWTAVVTFVIAIVTWLPALEGVPSWFPEWAHEELVGEVCLICTLVSAAAFIAHSTLCQFGFV